MNSKTFIFKQILFLVLACLSIFTSPAISLLMGLIFALTFKNPFPIVSKKISKKMLQYSVICLGFGMNLHESLQAGKEGMIFTIFSVTFVMVIGFYLGKLFSLSKHTSYLISAGTAICGGSAIAAIAPITKSKADDITISLATIFILNAVALLIFPSIGRFLNMTDKEFGTWAAIAIHDTSSVVGAGAAYSETALKIATTVKLTRALWIIPLAVITSFIFKEKTSKISIPWFILFFIIAMIANTFFNIPSEITKIIVLIARKALILTLFLIGADLSRETIKNVGIRPLLLGISLWILIAVISLVLILVIE